MATKRATFCTVDFKKKRELRLTLNEYVLLDIAFHLSARTGWCYASKDYLADTLDISRQSVFNLINKLIKNNWIEKDSATKSIRTTEKWQSNYSEDYNIDGLNITIPAQSKNDTDSKESLLSKQNHSKETLLGVQIDSKETLQSSKESLHNTYTISKDKNYKNSEEKNIPEIKISENNKPNFIQTLYNIFTDEYKRVRGYEFETDTIKKEHSAIGKIAQGYKQRNPGKTTDEAMEFLTDYFTKCLRIENDFLKRSMSPSLILNQKTQINTIIKEGNYANNTTNIGNNQTSEYRNLPGGRVTASFAPEDYKGGWDG